MREKAVTVTAVAKAAGVSYTTAAATYRGEAWVPEATAAKVRRAGERLGYRRNPAASVLASRRHFGEAGGKPVAVGWLVSIPPYEGQVLRQPESFRELLRERGWIYHFANVLTRREAQQKAREWEAIGVDAVVLSRVMLPAVYAAFPWKRFTVVSTEIVRLAEGFDVVRPSYFFALLRMLREISARGYRRIGCWIRTHAGGHPDDDAKIGAVLAHHFEERRERAAIPPLVSPFGQWDVRDPLEAWLDRWKPDAVVTANAMDASLIAGTGRKVPEEMAVAALVTGRRDGARTAGLLDREEMLPQELLNALERKLRTGQRGPSRHPQEIIHHLQFVEGPTLPRKAP